MAEITQRWARVLSAVALVVLLGWAGHVEAQASESEATVTVWLSDLGLDFGAITMWEASLYAGAIEGQETEGRFTEWVSGEQGRAVVHLPGHLLAEAQVPWDVEGDVYVRVRSLEAAYPAFDLVSDPFTLRGDAPTGWRYVARVTLTSTMTRTPATLDQVTITLEDLGCVFGGLGSWEASLYAGATPGEETTGRFTEWVAAQNGLVAFQLPEDVLEGMTAPWAVPEGAYARIRQVGEGYPTFDLVGRPFTLTEDGAHETRLEVGRAAGAEEEMIAMRLNLPLIARGWQVAGVQ